MKDNSALLKKLAYDETFSCVQCGYCLPSCPTYLTFGKETHSPRGRINLVKLAAEGKIELSSIKESIDLCLGCRACETACPTNVEYGKILTSAVDVLTEGKIGQKGFIETKARKFLFKRVLPSRMNLNLLRTGLFAYQKTKVDKLVRKTKLLPHGLGELESITPDITKKWNSDVLPNNINQNKAGYKIGFFPGCIMETVFKDVNEKAIKLLESAKCEVKIIKEQGCCGALQRHAGEKDISIELAKKNIEAFEKYDFDYIVNTIGGCGASLVEYPLLFSTDDSWRERAEKFSRKVKDISVILHSLDLKYNKELNYKITYQPSCHLTNVQKVVDEPFELMNRIPGIKYIEMKNKDLCCGSAGIYNVEHFEESMLILENKVQQIMEIIPHIIVTTNPGCHLQMKLGVKRAGLEGKVKVLHLVELLFEACAEEK